MNKTYELNGITFIWDPNKAQININNHEGMTFEQAAEIFFDPFLKIIDTSPKVEIRDTVIGVDMR